MIGNWKVWEPPTSVPEPYEGHRLEDQKNPSPLTEAARDGYAVLTEELLTRDGPFPPEGGLKQPPLGGEGILNGLYSAMPNMSYTQTSLTS